MILLLKKALTSSIPYTDRGLNLCYGQKVEQINKLLDEAFENVPEYLDRFAAELPNLFKRYGLSMDSLQPKEAYIPIEKTPSGAPSYTSRLPAKAAEPAYQNSGT